MNKPAPIQLFPNNANLMHKMPGDSQGEFVTVDIGGKSRRIYMIDVAGGPQVLRTQVDISVDGTPYYLIAGKGVGSFQCTFLEGPFKTCTDTAVQDYSIMCNIDTMSKNLKNRRIRITTDTGLKSSSGRGSTLGRSIFNGVIHNIVQTMQGQDGGSIMVVSRIDAIGQWGNE